jgi:AcrR family transcriptional regulator
VDIGTIQERTFKDKELRIVEAYIDTVEKVGVEKVSLQKVADQAGVAYGSVHYYFGAEENSLRDSALIFIAQSSGEYLQKALLKAQSQPKVNSLHAYLEAKLRWNNQFPKYAQLWCYFLYLTTQNKEFRKLHGQMDEMDRNQIKTLIFQEVGKGRYKISPNQIEATCQIIHQTILGAKVANATSDRSKDQLAERLRLTMGAIESHLNANLCS